MKEFFEEYGMFCLEVVGGIIGIAIFFNIFWGESALIKETISNFVESLI